MVKSQVIKSQRGSGLFIYICFILLISLAGLKLINNKLSNLTTMKSITKQYHCVKEYTGEVKKHINKISKINKLILMAHYSKEASILIPGYGFVTRQSLKQVEQALMRTQDLIHVSFLKYLFHLNKKGCSLTAHIYKTPFEHNGLFLSRNKSNQAKIREKKWSTFIVSRHLRLHIIHSKENSKVHELL